MKADRSGTARKASSGRRRVLARLHVAWKEERRDLASDDERAEALREFARTELRMSKLKSLTELTTGNLCRLLDAMNGSLRTPRVGYQWAREGKSGGGEEEGRGRVIHLASREQTWALEKLLAHLGWDEQHTRNFLRPRFGVPSVRFLTPLQSQNFFRILANIAATNDLKKEGAEKVSRKMADKYIPELKRKLGIDQR